jgi:hypothetical protein
MWAVHAAVWLQLDLKPMLPASSSLRIERRSRVPVPDFLYFNVPPSGSSHAPERACDPIQPDVTHERARSDLTPLGWDPRAAPGFPLRVPVNGKAYATASPNITLNDKSHLKGSD